MPDHRPCFHIQPPANWANDPNGPLYWRGRFHLFYQHNPVSVTGGLMHWGHVVSTDLVRWSHLPVALAPGPDGPDSGGCWSGCAVVRDDAPTLIYTGVPLEGDRRVGSVCLATSFDHNLVNWSKDPSNPVIAGPPASLELVHFRDPCVWREDDCWWCVLGGADHSKGGILLLYSSADLRQWNYVGMLCSQHEADRATVRSHEGADSMPIGSGRVWECPQFFALGERHALLIAAWDKPDFQHTLYYIGSYRERVFTPELRGPFDLGAEYYAPVSMNDPQGRRLVWGWTKEGRSAEAQAQSGWAGALTLPRVVTLRDDGTLGIDSLPELASLRGRHYRRRDLALVPRSPLHLNDLRGENLEIAVEIACEPTSVVSLRIRRSPGDEEYTQIRYDRRAGRISVDRDHASLDPAAFRGVHGGTLVLAPNEPLTLRVFLDGSIVEVYANGRATLTERIYPTREDSLGVSLGVEGGDARVICLDAWEMRSAGLNTTGRDGL